MKDRGMGQSVWIQAKEKESGDGFYGTIELFGP